MINYLQPYSELLCNNNNLNLQKQETEKNSASSQKADFLREATVWINQIAHLKSSAVHP